MTACLRPSSTTAYLRIRVDRDGVTEVHGGCFWSQVMRGMRIERGSSTRLYSQRDARRWCKRRKVVPTEAELAAIATLRP